MSDLISLLRVTGVRLMGILVICLAARFTNAQPTDAPQVTLRISAAASLREVIPTIGELFTQQSAVGLAYNFGASGQLLAQIRQGAKVDVFISAARLQINQALEEKLANSESLRVIAGNRLVVIVPGASARTLTAFAQITDAKFERLALGQPASVPAGEYAMQAIGQAGLSAAVRPRLIYASNVRQVLEYVKRGEVDAGFVYASDAQEAGQAVHVVWTVAADQHDAIEYPAVVLRASAHPQLARRFVEHLLSPASLAILTAAGFSPPPVEAKPPSPNSTTPPAPQTPAPPAAQP